MGRIILGLLASLLMVCSLPAKANAFEPPMFDPLMRPPPYDYRWTLKKYPSICWMMRTRPPVGATMVFTLTDSHSIKPVVEIQLPNTIYTDSSESWYCVNLKDYDIQLEPNIQYRWYISIAQDPESDSQDVVGVELIERCGKKNCGILEMPSRCDRNSVMILAESRIFHDSISCLCELIKSSPEDKTLRWKLDALIRQAGLTLDPN